MVRVEVQTAPLHHAIHPTYRIRHGHFAHFSEAGSPATHPSPSSALNIFGRQQTHPRKAWNVILILFDVRRGLLRKRAESPVVIAKRILKTRHNACNTSQHAQVLCSFSIFDYFVRLLRSDGIVAQLSSAYQK